MAFLLISHWTFIYRIDLLFGIYSGGERRGVLVPKEPVQNKGVYEVSPRRSISNISNVAMIIHIQFMSSSLDK